MLLRIFTRESRSAAPDDYIIFLQEHEVDIRVVEDDQINFRQAMESSNSQKQIDAMNKEIKSMKDNDVRDLVPLSENAKHIGYKWIFKTKRDSMGNMEINIKLVLSQRASYRKKASITKRLSLWFHQKTLSLVSSKDSFRIIMALVLHFDLELYQMDVKTTFSMVKLLR